jgi:hypothetical protein
MPWKVESDFPLIDGKGGFKPTDVMEISFLVKGKGVFAKSRPLFMSRSGFLKFLKTSGAVPSWENWENKTKADGTILKQENGKPLKEWVAIEDPFNYANANRSLDE